LKYLEESLLKLPFDNFESKLTKAFQEMFFMLKERASLEKISRHVSASESLPQLNQQEQVENDSNLTISSIKSASTIYANSVNRRKGVEMSKNQPHQDILNTTFTIEEDDPKYDSSQIEEVIIF
jgi:hypothetical protein